MMKQTIIATVGCMLMAGIGWAGRPQANCPTKPKPNYKVSKLGVNEFAVSCLNGGDPTAVKHGDILIVSCGH